ncbi:HdeD family acid-resistance protein [Fodinicurvata fenggangensis]|uniref:HdeD family acid-resistance protein n=1 Tax=Fodinicurvata fenggangensis TaxID=1121830 RepID=UPI00047AD27F|nr:DUF6463 family protein [Fodinicurvata fenggangensis]
MPAGFSMDTEKLRKYSTWFMIYGIVLILLGAFAIIAPGIATIAVELMIGWLLLGSGLIGLVSVIRSGKASPGFWWNLLGAIIFLLAGIALLWDPVAGAVTLTMILAAYLLAIGIAKLISVPHYRRTITGSWGWIFFSAILDIVLGLLIVSGLPGSGLWILGLFVGINLLFSGLAIALTAYGARKISRTD